MLLVLLLLFSPLEAFILSAPAKPGSVCYGSLGCFDNAAPFQTSHRPVNFLPKSPEDIGTTFLLYTKDTPTTDKEETLNETDPTSITTSHFDASIPTKIIVHGFTHNGHRQWIGNMKLELLKNADMNIISVDWGKGAGLPYGQSAANCRVVGAQIAELINLILNNTFAQASQFHIIGHSLGAHVAGYAGERVKGIGRISGLDPAGPYFEHTDTHVRLDPSDAKYVDVIHTDATTLLTLGLGATQAMGHVDFYPNGGYNQPGCDRNPISKLTHTLWNSITIGYSGAEEAIACSHERSYHMYTETINSVCPFLAYPCTGVAEFNLGHCLTCLGDKCTKMGYHAVDTPSARGSLYLTTQGASTYCNYHYQLNITTETAMDGIVTITLHGSKADTKVVPVTKKGEVVNQGKVLTHLISTRKELGDITGVTISYDRTTNLLIGWMYSDDWKLMGVTVREGETKQLTSFCAYGKDVISHSHTDFKVMGHCS